MGRVTAEVRALLQGRQDRHKAGQFTAAGNQRLPDMEHTPLPSRSLLSPRRMGPYGTVHGTRPHGARHASHRPRPATLRILIMIFDEFNAERLRPRLTYAGPLARVGRARAARVGPEGLPAVQERLLKFKTRMRWGRPWCSFRRWAGLDESGTEHVGEAPATARTQ